MNQEWAEDFSYDYLQRFYQALQKKFKIAQLGNAEEVIQAKEATVFIRHDIDVSLDRALKMAHFENKMGIFSTYHVMLANPFYSAQKSVDKIKKIKSLGHEIGLHYDAKAQARLEAFQNIEDDAAKVCTQLENLMDAPIRSLSFHWPQPELYSGPLKLAGRISSYASELFKWYLSDSKARWREGEPLKSLENPRSQFLQVLVHPIWWDTEHQKPMQRLTNFLEETSQELNIPYKQLNDSLQATIDLRGEEK